MASPVIVISARDAPRQTVRLVDGQATAIERSNGRRRIAGGTVRRVQSHAARLQSITQLKAVITRTK